MLYKLYEFFVEDKQKAIVAFLLAAVGTFVAQHGFTLDMTLGEALESVSFGLVSWLGVYFKRNQ